MQTTVDVTDTAPLGHAEAMRLQATELERTLELLRSLHPHEWTAQTDCPDWDVRRMYLHVLGACEAAASMRENVHQMRAALQRRKKAGGPLEAALSAVQVRDREHLSPAELVERLADVAPATIRKRTKMPRLMRRMKMKVDGPVVEKWTLGYLTDTIYLRDLWMHRIDASRATGRSLVLTPDHDGAIVADVVAEWARRHARPVTLNLSGPAGGSYTATGKGEPVEAIELDAIEFCRGLAGRVDAPAIPTSTIVPF